METLTEPSVLRRLFSEGAQEVTIADAIEAFIRSEISGKRRSSTTVRWYELRLYSIAECVGGDFPIGSIQEGDLAVWYEHLAERATRYGGASARPEEAGRLSPYTLHGYVRAARRFFRWLTQRKVYDTNPAGAVDMPGLPKLGERGIADQDVVTILELAQSDDRDYAMLLFLANTGCRLGGIANLLLSDLQPGNPDPEKQMWATVREKGAKERMVFFTEETRQALLRWLDARPAIEWDQHVFLGRSPGQPWHGLKEAGIYAVIKTYAERAGVKERWSPHQWRHRFGRMMASNGMPLGVLAQIMGHTNVQVTVSYYGIFAARQLHQAYQQYCSQTSGK
jgi:integrase/recombinase XerD